MCAIAAGSVRLFNVVVFTFLVFRLALFIKLHMKCHYRVELPYSRLCLGFEWKKLVVRNNRPVREQGSHAMVLVL